MATPRAVAAWSMMHASRASLSSRTNKLCSRRRATRQTVSQRSNYIGWYSQLPIILFIYFAFLFWFSFMNFVVGLQTLRLRSAFCRQRVSMCPPSRTSSCRTSSPIWRTWSCPLRMNMLQVLIQFHSFMVFFIIISPHFYFPFCLWFFFDFFHFDFV